MCLAVPGEVIVAYDKEGVRYAEVRLGGVTREVCLHAFPDTQSGEYVLIHVGFAIAKIDREEASRAWELIAVLGGRDEIDALAQPEEP